MEVHQSEIEAMKVEIMKVKESFFKEQLKDQEAYQTLRRKYEEKIASLNKDIEELKEAAKGKEAQVDVERKKVIDQLKGDLAQITQKYDAMIVEAEKLKASEVRLNEEKNRLSAKLIKLQHQVEESNSATTSFRAAYENQTKRLMELEKLSSLGVSKGDISAVDLDQILEEFDTAKKEATKAKILNETLQKEKRLADELAVELRKESMDQLRKYQDLTEALSESKILVERLQESKCEQLRSLESSRKSSLSKDLEISSLKKALAEVKEQLDGFINTNSNNDERMETLEVQVEKYEKQLGAAMNTIKALSEDVFYHREKLKAELSVKTKLADELEALKSKSYSVESDLSSTIGKRDEELEHLRRELTELKATLQSERHGNEEKIRELKISSTFSQSKQNEELLALKGLLEAANRETAERSHTNADVRSLYEQLLNEKEKSTKLQSEKDDWSADSQTYRMKIQKLETLLSLEQTNRREDLVKLTKEMENASLVLKQNEDRLAIAIKESDELQIKAHDERNDSMNKLNEITQKNTLLLTENDLLRQQLIDVSLAKEIPEKKQENLISKKEYKSLQDDLQATKEENEKLKDMNQNLERIARTADRKYRETKEYYAHYTSSLEQWNKSNTVDLASKNEQMSSRLLQLQNDLVMYEEDARQQRKKKDHYKSELRQARDELNDMKRSQISRADVMNIVRNNSSSTLDHTIGAEDLLAEGIILESGAKQPLTPPRIGRQQAEENIFEFPSDDHRRTLVHTEGSRKRKRSAIVPRRVPLLLVPVKKETRQTSRKKPRNEKYTDLEVLY